MRCACTQANVYVFVTNPERKLATSFTLGADGGDAKRTVSGKPFGLYGRFIIMTAYRISHKRLGGTLKGTYGMR